MGLGSREYYMRGKKSELVQAYLKYMVDSAVMFGMLASSVCHSKSYGIKPMVLGAEQPEAERQMEEVLDFEMMIANVRLTIDDLCVISTLG